MTSKLPLATRRRIEYCQGYLLLGLHAEAEAEIAGIARDDREAPEVLETEMTLRYGAEQWDQLFGLARHFTVIHPEREQGWISLACALRRLEGVVPAKAILLQADPRFGRTSATLNYNLACYYCLLGELGEARGRLARAFELSRGFRQEARRDPDLQRLWSEIEAMP
jgi:hypothetical protein